MAKITNTSPRMLHLGGTMCPPGQAVEVPDTMLEKQAVKDMIEADELAVGEDADKAEANLRKKQEAEATATATAQQPTTTGRNRS